MADNTKTFAGTGAFKKNQLLVIDELTAGISPEDALATFRNIKHQYSGITILMATHLEDFET